MASAAASPTDQAAALAQSEDATDAQGSLAAADALPADAPARAIATSAISRPTAPAPNTPPPAAASPPTAANAPAGAELTPGVGRARLRLSFSADSWVDIRDYSGKQIFEGNGRANSVKTIAGTAPFRVYLRSASGVQLQLNDRAVAIGRQFISGDEARFEAGADGVLRRDVPAAGRGPETAAVSPHG
jgi:cytoskeleton protein RodZ